MLALVREAGAERSYGAARRLFFCLPSSIGGRAILSICSGRTHLNIMLLIVKLRGRGWWGLSTLRCTYPHLRRT